LQAIEKLADELGPTKFLVLEYHINDSYANHSTLARLLAYGVTSWPTVYFNGANPVLGGGYVVQDDYDTYKSKISSELSQPSPVSINASRNFSSDALVVNVMLTNTSDHAITNAQLVGVTYLDHGQSQYRAVVNDMSSASAPVNLAPGVTLTLQLTFERPVATAEVVVLLKIPGRVLQSALAF
jgi:hypothetical protein